MIIKPKCKGFICTTAHPTGCKEIIKNDINYLKKQGKFQGPKKVLVLGSSAGYGLSSRMSATFNYGADTIGVFYERPYAESKPASAGWYNTAAFEEFANKEGYYAKSINGDAFSNDIKQKVISLIKSDLKKIDLVIYSLAAPRRISPENGEVYSSCLKPIGESFSGRALDFHTGLVSEVCITPATEQEIKGTIGVMGGEDWKLWIEALLQENLLEEGAKTIAYSYIGPAMTRAVYRDGTIGRAKEHLENTAKQLNSLLGEKIAGSAYVSVNKALVTQASSAIPVVPLYISILYKVMKEKGIHEECTQQIFRLFRDVYNNNINIDEKGRIRVDDLEMREDVQNDVSDIWARINCENIMELSDLEGYRKSFYNLFGFEVDGIDYDKDTEPYVSILGLVE
jgi:enoyl-[acyl-carrier protein] reductase/trans-2-enoyl-CoA reductase (NAD+)